MTDHAASIRSKLTQAELTFLKENFGIDLRDPEVVAVMTEFEEAREQIVAMEERALRKVREREGQSPHCSFCGATSHVVGPLAKSSRGSLICSSCAAHCIAEIEESLKHEP